MYLNTILNSHLNDFPISLNIHFKTHLSNEKQGVLKKSQVLKLISWNWVPLQVAIKLISKGATFLSLKKKNNLYFNIFLK